MLQMRPPALPCCREVGGLLQATPSTLTRSLKRFPAVSRGAARPGHSSPAAIPDAVVHSLLPRLPARSPGSTLCWTFPLFVSPGRSLIWLSMLRSPELNFGFEQLVFMVCSCQLGFEVLQFLGLCFGKASEILTRIPESSGQNTVGGLEKSRKRSRQLNHCCVRSFRGLSTQTNIRERDSLSSPPSSPNPPSSHRFVIPASHS